VNDLGDIGVGGKGVIGPGRVGRASGWAMGEA